MSPLLTLRCELAADESVSSWVSRLAMCNGVASAREFCLDMGLTFQACVDGEPAALAKLHALTGIPLHRLETASIAPDGSAFRLRGERFSQTMLRRKTIRVCPICVQQDIQAAEQTDEPAPYGRTLWQLSVFRACPHHACALITFKECPRQTTHDFVLNFRTHAEEIPQLTKSVITRKSSALEAYVRGRLEGEKSSAAWLDALDLYVAITTCEMLGTLMIYGGGAKIKALSDVALHEAGETGFQVASGGEVPIRDALEQIRQRHPYNKSGREGADAIYGCFYRLLAENQKKADYEPVRDVLRRHIMETMPVGPGDIVMGRAVEKRVWHSITTASQETGRHPKRLRKALVAAGLLTHDHAPLSDHYILFEAERARAFLAADTHGLTLKEVGTYLNSGRVQAELFASHGFIRPHVEYRGRRNERRPTYAIEQLDAFLASLLKGATLVDHPGSLQHSIPTAAKRAQCTAAEIIELILTKQLKWVGRHASVAGYPSVLVDISEIKRCVEGPKLGGVGVWQARSTLGTTRQVVEALTRKGYLRRISTIYPVSRNPVEMISFTDLQAFRAKYVSIAELSKTRRVHHSCVMRALSNVHPAIEKSQVGANFYHRDAIPDF